MPLLPIVLITIICAAHFGTAQLQVNINQKAITTSTGNDVDDCAIWVHPTDPSKSRVIINDKGSAESAGLYTYDLSGKLIQKIPVYRPQNPDLRYHVAFGNDTIDVLVCVDREAGNNIYNRIRVFKIDPLKMDDTCGFLTEITTSSGIPTGLNEPYGHSLYQRPSDGALFSIVGDYGIIV
ncbi:MAG TPA: phytase, partial [Chitinispirillaceae bacterium]|nr:phytase [Chitinispirillaceae bacterium]